MPDHSSLTAPPPDSAPPPSWLAVLALMQRDLRAAGIEWPVATIADLGDCVWPAESVRNTTLIRALDSGAFDGDGDEFILFLIFLTWWPTDEERRVMVRVLRDLIVRQSEAQRRRIPIAGELLRRELSAAEVEETLALLRATPEDEPCRRDMLRQALRKFCIPELEGLYASPFTPRPAPPDAELAPHSLGVVKGLAAVHRMVQGAGWSWQARDELNADLLRELRRTGLPWQWMNSTELGRHPPTPAAVGVLLRALDSGAFDDEFDSFFENMLGRAATEAKRQGGGRVVRDLIIRRSERQRRRLALGGGDPLSRFLAAKDVASTTALLRETSAEEPYRLALLLHAHRRAWSPEVAAIHLRHIEHPHHTVLFAVMSNALKHNLALPRARLEQLARHRDRASLRALSRADLERLVTSGFLMLRVLDVSSPIPEGDVDEAHEPFCLDVRRQSRRWLEEAADNADYLRQLAKKLLARMNAAEPDGTRPAEG